MSSDSNASWSSAQVYGFALVCLLIGLAGGYFFAGSSGGRTAEPAIAQQAAMPQQAPQSMPAGAEQVTPEQMKHMAEKQAEPLLAQLKDSPKDVELLARIGNIYYDTQQYQTAIGYYSRALQIKPNDANIRTDMATAYWYLRDVDRALAEFDKSLSYDPKHPGTLLNKGVVLWQGKNDTKGAVAAWQKLLDTNPTYPDRQKIVELIARAKEHGSRGMGPKG